MVNKENRECGNCENCSKFISDGKETWACEEYGFYYLGSPADVTPPHNEACPKWTDDPKKANAWERWV